VPETRAAVSDDMRMVWNKGAAAKAISPKNFAAAQAFAPDRSPMIKSHTGAHALWFGR